MRDTHRSLLPTLIATHILTDTLRETTRQIAAVDMQTIARQTIGQDELRQTWD